MYLIKWGLILSIVVGVFWALVPWGVRWQINEQLTKIGLESSLKDLSIDYVAGDFILRNWEVRHQGRVFLQAEELHLAPDLGAWWAERLALRKLSARGLRVNWQASSTGVSLAGLPAKQWQSLLKLDQGAQFTAVNLEQAEFCQTADGNEQCWVFGAGQASDLTWRWDKAGWQLASRSTLVLDKARLQNQKANLAVFLVEKSQIRDFVFSNDWSRMAQCQLTGLHLVERSLDEQKNVENAYQTQASSVLINDLGYKPGQPAQLHLDLLDITRLRQTLHQNRDQVMLATAQLRQFLPQTEQFFNAKTPLTLAINKTRIFDGAVAWRDDSVTPAVNESLTGLNGELGSLNSLKPNDPTSLTLVTQMGKNSEFQLRGQIRPFQEPLSFELQGSLRGIQLPKYDSYFANLYQERPASGQLDGSINLSSSPSQFKLDGQITLTDLLTVGDGNLSTQGRDMTLGRAFERLRGESKYVQIEWHFAVDPSKEPGPLKTALAKSFKTTLLRMVQNDWRSAGVNNLAGLGSNPDGPLSFDPFRFSPNERELSPDQARRLKDLAALVARRPKEKLKLCAIATSVEWSALYHHGAPLAPGTLVSEDQLQYLIDLSTARVRNIKGQLGELGINNQRFISCEPKVEMGAKIMSHVGVGMEGI
ncbi:MAG: hypothetical protein RL497_192 [Pseudomonadota bacterium]|jgi:hypothetical protein